MTNNPEKSYDLEARTLEFSKGIINFTSKLRQTNITMPMINQLIRSSTSIGANYTEANNASSRRDFRNKICICKKESQETKYWLNLLPECYPDESRYIKDALRECHEFVLIFQRIISSLDNKS
jgi:four helix bundle protein